MGIRLARGERGLIDRQTRQEYGRSVGRSVGRPLRSTSDGLSVGRSIGRRLYQLRVQAPGSLFLSLLFSFVQMLRDLLSS